MKANAYYLVEKVMDLQNETDVSVQPLPSRVPTWFQVLILITLALNVVVGVLVVRATRSYPSEAIHLVGALCWICMVVIGLGSQLISPAPNIAGFQQAFMTGLALIATAMIVGDPDNHARQYGPFDLSYLISFAPLLCMAIYHPARRDLFKPGRIQTGQLLAAAILAVPSFAYGVNQALLQRNSFPPSADPHHNSHWFIMAELAFAIPLIAGVAGLQARGWRMTVWSVPATLTVLGAVSVLFPGSPSSLGTVYGLLAIAAAVGLLMLIRYTSRRQSDPLDQM